MSVRRTSTVAAGLGIFWWAAAAALGACHVYVDEPPKVGEPRYYSPTAPYPPYAAGPRSPAPRPAAPPPQSSNYGAGSPLPRRRVRPYPRGSAAGASGPGVSAETTTVGDNANATCLDDAQVTVPECSTLAPDPVECAPVPTPRQRCRGYQAYFDPRVAASAVACISSLSRPQLCDRKAAADCGQIALAEACLDNSVNQLCQIAASPCKTTEAECAALISGLNDQGQQAIAQCVARGCSGGIDGCLDALTSGR